ncbi:hypothetical protein DRN73_03655, partial [Candidatus Pacearchaeota archaeon]
FSPFDTIHTALLLQILAIGLPFYGLSKTSVPLFYSLGKTIIPALGSVVAVITNVTIILLTIKKLGINAVALGTSLSLGAQAIFLLSIAFYFLKTPDFLFLIKSLFALFFASLILILVCKLVLIYIHNKFLILILAIPAGGIAYILSCKITGIRETYMFFEKLIKIFKR